MKSKNISGGISVIFFLAIVLALSTLYVPIKSIISFNNTTDVEGDSFVPLPYEDELALSDVFDENVLGAQPEGTVKVPVLMYHNIASVPSRGSASYRGLFVSPSVFRQQMKYLKDNNYKTLTPAEFFEILKSGKNPRQKSVLITFDDGSRGQYKYAYPVLKKYKMTATFYIIAERSPIKIKEIREMARNGMIIDSHTSTHRDLKRLKGTKNLDFELRKSKRTLRNITNQGVVSIAYPGCVADSRTFKIVKEAGYKVGFSCGSSIYHRYRNRYYLSRVHVYSNMSSFKKMLNSGM